MGGLSPRRGKLAEDAAREALCAAGYTVIESNYRVRGAELDHVCRDDGGFVFVEVKGRSPGDLEASAAVTALKLRRLMRGARAWLARHGATEADWRFVVVAVDLDATGRPVASSIIEDPFAHLPEYHDGEP